MDEVSLALGRLPSLSAANNYKKLDADLRQYVASLSPIQDSAKRAIFSKPIQSLQAIDPRVNSIGYLAILHLLLQSPDKINPNNLRDPILHFILNFDPVQARYVGSRLLNLLDRIADSQLFSALVTVQLLAVAILKVDSSGSVFTSTHFTMLKLAYDSGHLEAAMVVLDKDILAFPLPLPKDAQPLCEPDLAPSYYVSASIGLTHKVKHHTVLEYDLLCGLAYISTRNWTKAMEALERVVTHPVKDKAVSKIMVEAYKKWILVGLLQTGQVPTLPSYANVTAKLSYGTLSEVYAYIGTLFVASDASELLRESQAQSNVWLEDVNQGLIVEVLSAYQKWQILNLRQVYRQVSVSTIRKETASAVTGQPLSDNNEVLVLLQDMMESDMLKGEVHAAQEDGEHYLTFHDDTSLVTEQYFAREIVQVQVKLETLGKEYKVVNERLSAHKDYARHVWRDQRRSEKEAQDATGGFETQVEDEDLMTGIVSND